MPFWLSMHARYRCQHAGACCTARWPIPLETSRVEIVRQAVGHGRIVVPAAWITSTVDAPDDVGGMLAIDEHGQCVFHQHDRCAIHGVAGHAALPSACQHFPRVCVIDPRGVFVTLSHFCPTAAWTLFDDAPISIVDGPSALPNGELPEGLDVREAWPPLLTDRVLMDHASYGVWERHMVGVLAGPACAGTPEAALARVRADAEWLCDWKPGRGPLCDAVERLRKSSAALKGGRYERGRIHHGEVGRGRPLGRPRSPAIGTSLFDLVRGAVLPPLVWAAAPAEFERTWTTHVAPTWSEWTPVVRRFLAAHAFGSWLAYQGRDLLTVVRGLEAALAVLQVELVRACHGRNAPLDRATLHAAIRQADLMLRHYVDRQALADALSGRG
jgi:Fe-S-cluster containining protein